MRHPSFRRRVFPRAAVTRVGPPHADRRQQEDRLPQQVQGVISRAKDAPVELVTINVPDPGPGEAVVTVQACGVCHTDLHYVQGGIGDDYPYLLGHEAAGIVEAVGEGVRDSSPATT